MLCDVKVGVDIHIAFLTLIIADGEDSPFLNIIGIYKVIVLCVENGVLVIPTGNKPAAFVEKVVGTEDTIVEGGEVYFNAVGKLTGEVIGELQFGSFESKSGLDGSVDYLGVVFVADIDLNGCTKIFPRMTFQAEGSKVKLIRSGTLFA